MRRFPHGDTEARRKAAAERNLWGQPPRLSGERQLALFFALALYLRPAFHSSAVISQISVGRRPAT